MKLDAALLDEEMVVGRVVASVQAVSGLPLERISLDSRLREDLGIAGDDGYELMASLHDQFEMDWTGFDLGIHFGDEGIGPPLQPWRAGRSAAGLHPRPLTISQLADALRKGRWPGSPKVPRSPGQRRSLLAAGWVQLVLLASLVLAALGVVLADAVVE